MAELTDFQWKLLGIISGTAELHGLEIKKRIENTIDKPVNHGRLYPNLDQLVELGFIEKGELDRRTNYYEPTEKGDTALKNHFSWFKEQYQTDINNEK